MKGLDKTFLIKQVLEKDGNGAKSYLRIISVSTFVIFGISKNIGNKVKSLYADKKVGIQKEFNYDFLIRIKVNAKQYRIILIFSFNNFTIFVTLEYLYWR